MLSTGASQSSLFDSALFDSALLNGLADLDGCGELGDDTRLGALCLRGVLVEVVPDRLLDLRSVLADR